MVSCPAFLLGFRGRVLPFGLASAGLACLWPGRPAGFAQFVMTAPALCLLGLVLVLVGSFVEEQGTLARVRAGILIRMVAPATVLFAAIWQIAAGTSSRSEGAGWIFFVAGILPMALVTTHDVACFRDLRHGQPRRLERISSDGLHLSVRSVPILVPPSALLGAALCSYADGRGLLLVTRRDRIVGDSTLLPWNGMTPDGDAFMLTEYEMNADARTVLSAVTQMVDGAKAYRT